MTLREARRPKSFTLTLVTSSVVSSRLAPERILSLCWVRTLTDMRTFLYWCFKPVPGIRCTKFRAEDDQHRTWAAPPAWGNLMKTNRPPESNRQPDWDASKSARVDFLGKLSPFRVTSGGSPPDTWSISGRATEFRLMSRAVPESWQSIWVP